MEEVKMPQNTLLIKREYFNRLWEKSVPLFYYNQKRVWNKDRKTYEDIWFPEDSSVLTNIFYDDDIKHKINQTFLLYGKPIKGLVINQSSDIIQIEYEEFEPTNYSHVRSVFLLHLLQRNDPNDRFAYRDLLWLLNNYFIDYNIITSVLNSFDSQSILPFLLKEFKYISSCLSLPKQELIKSILNNYGITYKIYYPFVLEEALKFLYPNYNPQKEWFTNIFDLVDKVINISEEDQEEPTFDIKSNDSTNFLLKLRRWLVDEDYNFSDFNQLTNWLRLFPTSTQLLMLKRYFLAIQKGQTNFDINILSKFKENKYENLRIFQHSVLRASKPVEMGLELLCDNILTFLNSNGTALQTINGTLDLAYIQCNVSHPNVDFQLEKIVPVCNGGAVQNKSGFKGFICYEIVYTLNQTIFLDDESLKETVIKIIDRLSTYRHKRVECNFIPPENVQNYINKTPPDTCSFSNCENYQVLYLDRWNFSNNTESRSKVVNLFLKSNKISPSTERDIGKEDIIDDVNIIRDNIKNFLKTLLPVVPGQNNYSQGYQMVHSLEWENKLLIDNILLPGWIIVEPRKNAYVGMGLLYSKIEVPSNVYIGHNDIPTEIKEKESNYLKSIINSSLKNFLNQNPDNNGRYIIPYDKKMLNDLRAKYYTDKSFPNGTSFDDRNLNFLQRLHNVYAKYCAPEYDNDKNNAIDIPYYWCHGNECYKNALGEQTLETCKSWREYNIFHFLEILGYSQIRKTDAGFEPTKIIKDFIGMVNKAAKKFRRIFCRDCGHILFPTYRNTFNQYNNFECRNPLCVKRNEKVYLSQCHHCKTGLIDSRDSNPCPNGWTICPVCLSCCTDNLLENRAQKYIRKGQSVPHKLQLSRGHNNNNLYFCPNCGGEIRRHVDTIKEEVHFVCEVCQTDFPKASNWIK